MLHICLPYRSVRMHILSEEPPAHHLSALNTPRHYVVWASDYSLNFKLVYEWSQALRRTASLLSAILIFVSTGTEN